MGKTRVSITTDDQTGLEIMKELVAKNKGQVLLESFAEETRPKELRAYHFFAAHYWLDGYLITDEPDPRRAILDVLEGIEKIPYTEEQAGCKTRFIFDPVHDLQPATKDFYGTYAVDYQVMIRYWGIDDGSAPSSDELYFVQTPVEESEEIFQVGHGQWPHIEVTFDTGTEEWNKHVIKADSYRIKIPRGLRGWWVSSDQLGWMYAKFSVPTT